MKRHVIAFGVILTSLFLTFMLIRPIQAQGPNPLSIEKTVTLTNHPAQPGDPLTYTIVISNGGGVEVTNVRITDTLPAYVDGADLDVTTNISANTTLTFTINASVTLNAPFSTTIVNTAHYSYSGGSNQDTITFTTSQTPGLMIIKPTPLNPAYAGPYTSPQKIIISTTKPENGLPTSAFEVKIGAFPGTIITRYEGSETYVLEVDPPTQPADGLYGLIVSATTNTGVVSDTKLSAVYYAPVNQVDVMLLIDRSGSMRLDNNIEKAKDAAKQFVDLMQDNDKIGVASFNSTATLNYTLTTVISNTRTEAKDATDPLTATGTTSIGAGLELSQGELNTNGESLDPWAIVLLSDGMENTAPMVADVLPAIIQTKTVIHTIGLGSFADEPLLQNIALQTGGTYNFVPSGQGQDLSGVYNTIAGAVSGQQTLISLAGVVQAGATDTKSVVIDSTLEQATFSISWSDNANTLDLTLEDPQGNVIDPADPNVSFVSGPNYQYYQVTFPTLTPGTWLMKITNGAFVQAGLAADAIEASEEPYVAQVRGQSDLEANVYIDETTFLPGDPIKISITLSDEAPIKGAQVLAVVGPLIRVTPTALNDEPNPLLYLYDDGAHSDGFANDGVYANLLPGSETTTVGTYNFTVFANGLSNRGEIFARESRRNVFVGVTAPLTFQGDNPHFIYLSFIAKP